jgi:hypothetical protein
MSRFAVLSVLALVPALGCTQIAEPDQLSEAMTPVPSPVASAGIVGGEGVAPGPVSCGLGPRNDFTMASSDSEPSRSDSTTHQ